jgi:hypothetical protein
MEGTRGIGRYKRARYIAKTLYAQNGHPFVN